MAVNVKKLEETEYPDFDIPNMKVEKIDIKGDKRLNIKKSDTRFTLKDMI